MSKQTLHDRLKAAMTMALVGVDWIHTDALPAPKHGGQWDADALTAYSIARHLAARCGAYPVFHDTGDGWLFAWESDDIDSDPTETCAPLLPEDWWPGPDALSRSELESLGMVEV